MQFLAVEFFGQFLVGVFFRPTPSVGYFFRPTPSLPSQGGLHLTPPSPLAPQERGGCNRTYSVLRTERSSLRYPPAKLSPYGLAACLRNRVAISLRNRIAIVLRIRDAIVLRLIGGFLCGVTPPCLRHPNYLVACILLIILLLFFHLAFSFKHDQYLVSFLLTDYKSVETKSVETKLCFCPYRAHCPPIPSTQGVALG